MDKIIFWNKINDFFSSAKNGELWLYGSTLAWEEDDEVLQFDFSKYLIHIKYNVYYSFTNIEEYDVILNNSMGG